MGSHRATPCPRSSRPGHPSPSDGDVTWWGDLPPARRGSGQRRPFQDSCSFVFHVPSGSSLFLVRDFCCSSVSVWAQSDHKPPISPQRFLEMFLSHCSGEKHFYLFLFLHLLKWLVWMVRLRKLLLQLIRRKLTFWLQKMACWFIVGMIPVQNRLWYSLLCPHKYFGPFSVPTITGSTVPRSSLGKLLGLRAIRECQTSLQNCKSDFCMWPMDWQRFNSPGRCWCFLFVLEDEPEFMTWLGLAEWFN